MIQITPLTLPTAQKVQQHTYSPISDAPDFAAVLEEHITANAALDAIDPKYAPSSDTRPTSKARRSDATSSAGSVRDAAETSGSAEPRCSDPLSQGTDRQDVDTAGSIEAPDATVARDTAALKDTDNEAATEISKADDDTTADATAAVLAQLSSTQVPPTAPAPLPALAALAPTGDEGVANLEALNGSAPISAEGSAPLAQVPATATQQSAEAGAVLPTTASSSTTTPAAVVELAVIVESGPLVTKPATDSFESTLLTVTTSSDTQDAHSAAPHSAATTAAPEVEAPGQTPSQVTLSEPDGVPQASAGPAPAKTPATPTEKTLEVPSSKDASAPGSLDPASATQLRATAPARGEGVKEPTGVVQTENIRSEVWEIAKRAQALSRVEAVIRTSQGDLTVVARHTATGVSVTLGGAAVDSLDMTTLRNELTGLDVSLSQDQREHRAPQDEQDTISPRAVQAARPTVRTTTQTTQGLLDTHA